MHSTLLKTLAILCLSAFISPALDARDIYVDPSATGAGDGTSWVDAHTNMQAAVADANSVIMADRIHVAAGHYVSYFSYVITDPCTVHSNGSGPVIFENITATRPVFEVDNTDIHFYDIEFQSSSTHVYGYRSGVRFDGCVFTHASLSSIVGDQCTVMYFGDCKFEQNASIGRGGAIMSSDSQLVTVHRCVFEQNNSSDHGGAVFCVNHILPGRLECHDTRFVGNASARNGGAINLINTHATLINNVLTLNDATCGGAIAFRCTAGLSSLHLVNTTVFRNQAFHVGGIWRGPSMVGNTRCVIANSIIYNNASSSTSVLHGQLNRPPTSISHSCVDGWGSLPWLGFGMISSAPMLLPNGCPAVFSPCIDAGNAALCPVHLDITGSPRVVGPNIDMGAYER